MGEAFKKSFKVTVGIDFKVKEFVVDGKPVKVQIWDTAGQERFRSVATNYYRKACGVILVYDVNNLESFQNIEEWIDLLNQHIDEGVVRILVGNKVDKESKMNPKAVSTQMGSALAAKYGIKFLEVSAKTDRDLGDAMQELVRDIQKSGVQVQEVDKIETRINVLGESNGDDEKLDDEKSASKRWGCCGGS